MWPTAPTHGPRELECQFLSANLNVSHDEMRKNLVIVGMTFYKLTPERFRYILQEMCRHQLFKMLSDSIRSLLNLHVCNDTKYKLKNTRILDSFIRRYRTLEIH